MYIALKWLIGLSLAMWVAMCAIDIVLLKHNKELNEGLKVAVFEYNRSTFPEQQKVVDQKENYRLLKSKEKTVSGLHCLMFLAGALAVTLFNKKNDIILFTKDKIAGINIPEIRNKVKNKLKETASEVSVATLQFLTVCKGQCRELSLKLKNMIIFLQSKRVESHIRLNLILLKKVKEMGNERKTLGQLLIAAIHENKNIRLQYQLETMAKGRLERHIEDTQKQVKENRSRYVSFQQLYLVTHQENMFLKTRIEKVIKDKEEAENNLMNLISEIYKSQSNDLKAYCSRMIVPTKENLLQSDVSLEIQKFLKKGEMPLTTEVNCQLFEKYGLHAQPKGGSISSQRWTSCSTSRFTEILQDGDNMLPLISDVPRLKGLPGEYVWTVKDKDGIIEKLYEYDFESDFDNGDTIRRIREYSVYHDKDCLLDFRNSRTAIQQAGGENSAIRDHYLGLDYPLTSQGFLTGSDAFQKFLESSKNFVQSTRSPATSLVSE